MEVILTAIFSGVFGYFIGHFNTNRLWSGNAENSKVILHKGKFYKVSELKNGEIK